MTIEELEDKHFWNVQFANKYNYLLREDKTYITNNHTHLSVQFAIETLEALKFSFDIMSDMSSKTHGYRFLKEKIQELKKYLNEKV